MDTFSASPVPAEVSLRAAVIQMNAGLDIAANLAAAKRLVRQAAAQGAKLILLPELFHAYGPLRDVAAQAETIPGPTSERCAGWAKELKITLCAGSLCERSPIAGKGYNTSLIFGPTGEQLARYRKVHLFDAAIPGQPAARESEWMLAGDEAAVTRVEGFALAQAICYDLRFPELFRALASQGMDVLLLPSAFTRATGRDHWEVLVRARAIENQCYVLAANQHGAHATGMASYGGSLIVDPWGAIMSRAPLDEDAVLMADLSHDALRTVRERLPALAHRRFST